MMVLSQAFSNVTTQENPGDHAEETESKDVCIFEGAKFKRVVLRIVGCLGWNPKESPLVPKPYVPNK